MIWMSEGSPRRFFQMELLFPCPETEQPKSGCQIQGSRLASYSSARCGVQSVYVSETVKKKNLAVSNLIMWHNELIVTGYRMS